MTRAGEIYRSGRRKVRVEQVRDRKGGSLGYALVRFTGRPSRYLYSRAGDYDYPITVQLMPDGSMPLGYILASL